ncbi:MAG: hypothetical protein KC503_01245 [Myxococcales bacterium]|nr:hypothetical protein [Myxococcales bacterium]
MPGISPSRALAALLAAALLVVMGACSDSTSPTDGPPRETSADSGPDGPKPDGPIIPDGPVPDTTSDGVPDTPGNSVPVVFSTNSNTSAYTLYTVNTDGTGAAPVAGLSADLALLDIDMAGPSGPIAVRTDRPLQRVVDSEDFIHLPNGARVYRYADATNIGLLLIRDGAATKLDEAPIAASYGASSGNYFVTVSRDGKVLVAIKNQNQLMLLRLDGTNWPGTQSGVLDASAASWSADVQTIVADSLTAAATHVYFQTTGSAPKLWRAPLDGSAKASEITVAGASYFDEGMAVSNDGSTVAFVAGGGSTSNEVYSLADGANSAPVKVSAGAQARNHYGAGNALFDSGHPRLAVSPTGKVIAYGHTGSGSNWPLSIYAVNADGSGNERINLPANLDSTVDTFRHFVWADDDNLVFWGGAAVASQDAYRYQVSTKALSNITKTASATSAPWGAGTLSLDGGWIEPGGKFFYGVADDGTGANLLAIDLTSYTSKWITTGLDLPTASSSLVEDYRGSAAAKMVCFVGRGPASPTLEDVFAFDQSTASTAVNLTKHGDPSGAFARYLEISPDNKYCSYQSGNGAASQYYIVRTDGSSAPQAMTSTPTATNSGSYVWTSDSSGIVFGAGGSSSTGSLLYSDVGGGGSAPIYTATAGYIYVFGAK